MQYCQLNMILNGFADKFDSEHAPIENASTHGRNNVRYTAQPHADRLVTATQLDMSAHSRRDWGCHAKHQTPSGIQSTFGIKFDTSELADCRLKQKSTLLVKFYWYSHSFMHYKFSTLLKVTAGEWS
jgi:hypothetical protein